MIKFVAWKISNAIYAARNLRGRGHRYFWQRSIIVLSNARMLIKEGGR
jgi:hypothetical protein